MLFVRKMLKYWINFERFSKNRISIISPPLKEKRHRDNVFIRIMERVL